MSMLVWVMMAIAIWHFTVWVPDRFWGGIVGAFLVAVVSSVIFGFIVNGFNVPGRHDTHIVQALIAIPGSLIGLALSYWYGGRQLAAERPPPPPPRRRARSA
jgi:ABC-type tungstate transport system substrate-binding protein